MADRYDALTVREYTDRNGDSKSQWTKIGSAWPTQNGGFSITLDALPLPVMGKNGLETRIMLMVPKPRDDKPAQNQSYGDTSRRNQRADDDDDNVPF